MIGSDYSSHSLLPVTSQSTQQQQKLLPSRFDQLVRRLGQELSCAICLTIMEDPALTPCHHAFCKKCLDQLLRMAGKSEAPCPVCKLRITRRSILPGGRWVGLVEHFTMLAAEHEKLVGRPWDSLPSEDELESSPVKDMYKSSSMFTSIEDLQNGTSSIPSSPQIHRLEKENAQLTRELIEIDRELGKRRVEEYAENSGNEENAEIMGSESEVSSNILLLNSTDNKPSSAIFENIFNPNNNTNEKLHSKIRLPSSPEDLFCRPPTQPLIPPSTNESMTILSQSISHPMSQAPLICRSIVVATSLIRSQDPFMKTLSTFVSSFAQANSVSLLLNTDRSNISQFSSTTSAVDTSSSFTHLITPASSARIAKRTLKYLLAILNGIWIVSPEWIELSLETGRIVDEEYFEIRGDDHFPNEDAPKRARFSRQRRGESALFTGHSFYLYGQFGTPSKDDLCLLIRTGGGLLIETAADLEKHSSNNNVNGRKKRNKQEIHVICDPTEQSNFEKDAGVLIKFKPIISSTWILDCISAFQIIDPSIHIVL